MRIAFLTKRRYMRHDVIDDRYARLYELPANLARRGHEALGICLSYQGASEVAVEHDAWPGRLWWESSNAGRLLAPGLWAHQRRVVRRLRDFRPDVVMGASDALHVVMSRAVAWELGVPYAVDLYDNFESFGMTRIPPLGLLFRRAVREAPVVSCVSSLLSRHVRMRYQARGAVETIESTIAGDDFHPRGRDECRAALGLPPEGILVGTVGALESSRGVDALYRAFESIATERADVHLVLAGTPGKETPLPSGPRVHYLGQLPHTRVPLVYGALDVGVICVRDTPFGRFSFPQKAYEMAAMRIPLVVAAVGAMCEVFAEFPRVLYDAGRPDDLEHKLRHQLDQPEIPEVAIPTWADQAGRLETLLMSAARSG